MGFGKSKGKKGSKGGVRKTQSKKGNGKARGWGAVQKPKGYAYAKKAVSKGASRKGKGAEKPMKKGKGKGKKGKGKGKKATPEALDAELQEFMGVEAVGKRLDGELEAYMKAD